MKTYCKGIDITNPDIIQPWVEKCLFGKLNRFDFQDLLNKYGSAHGIAVEITKRIKNRNLNLIPIKYFTRLDGLSGKVRLLGMEDPMNQCMDYVAVGALMELFNAKIGPYQCASIPGRGQVYGKCALERWVQRDWQGSKYYIKADIKQCYPSLKSSVAYKFLSRDIRKNPLLLWFVMELLKQFKHGFSIGSYLSQYLCNYLLSYAYHYACESLYKERRGKRKRLCNHVLFYMDDIILLGGDKRDLTMAMKKLSKYLYEKLELTTKPGVHVKSVEKEPIDMMGYVVHKDYTTIRARVFLRARRQYLKAWRKIQNNRFLTLKHSYSLVSYFGFFKNSDSVKICNTLHVYTILLHAKNTIKYHNRKGGNNASSLFSKTKGSSLYAIA